MINYKIYGLKVIGSDEIRYVGLTKNSIAQRLNEHIRDQRRNRHKMNWLNVNRENIEIVLLEGGISTLQKANQREIYFIEFYKNLSCRLLNATIGGDGTKGFPSWNKGEACRYVEKLIKNSPRSRKVFAYDLLGNFIKEYRSIKYASIATSTSRNAISGIANGNPTFKQSKGIMFRWDRCEKINPIKRRTTKKRVKCIETGEIFDSIKEASECKNVSFSKLQSIIKDGEFSELDLLNKKHKPIKCIETGRVFSSIREASIEMKINYSSIGESIVGIRRRTAKGYTFIYI